MNLWPASGLVLYTTGQIFREYLVVATRPEERNGLGLARADAVMNARALRARMQLLAEDAKVSHRLIGLVDEVECAGRQVHDANVVASMLVHRVDTVVTSNVDDFQRLRQHVRIIGLSSL